MELHTFNPSTVRQRQVDIYERDQGQPGQKNFVVLGVEPRASCWASTLPQSHSLSIISFSRREKNYFLTELPIKGTILLCVLSTTTVLINRFHFHSLAPKFPPF